jgi:hypothetical protein
MDDRDRSREELLAELAELRERLAALEGRPASRTSLPPGDPNRRTLPLVEQVAALIWTTDLRLRLTWWKGDSMRHVTDKPDELIGRSVPEYLGTDDPTHPTLAAHLAALRGDFAAYEYELVDGVVLSSHIQPLTDGDGQIQGVIGVAIDISRRVQAERDRERLIGELRDALAREKALTGLIPICMHCKNIRNDDGYWEQVETWVRAHSTAEFTNAICPECMKRSLE